MMSAAEEGADIEYTAVPPLDINENSIAEICHAANKAFCELHNDYTQKPWCQTEKLLQDSVISGVKHRLANPLQTPEQSHEEWRKYKTGEGWIYDEYKSLEARTHPNLVPYFDLPPEEQMKDHLFTTIVRLFWTAKEYHRLQNQEAEK